MPASSTPTSATRIVQGRGGLSFNFTVPTGNTVDLVSASRAVRLQIAADLEVGTHAAPIVP